MPVMSVRLSDHEFSLLRTLASTERQERSSVVRELLMDGFKYKMLLGYREGKVSLSKLSKTLDLTVSEALELLAEFGLEAPISYDEYLQGLSAARKTIH